MEKEKINFWPWIRNVLTVSFKVALGIVGLTILVGVISLIVNIYDEHYGKYAHDYDRKLSENVCVHIFGNGKARAYDLSSGSYTTPRLDWVSVRPDRDSLAVFSKDGLRGFINVHTGKIVIENKYEHAWVFSEGLAAVVMPGKKMGFIDKSGKYVIDPHFDYMPTHDYVFKHGVCCIEGKNGLYKLLCKDGAWALSDEYDYIEYISDADMFVLYKDGKNGLLSNGDFEWVLPMEYDAIHWTDSPSGKGFILCKNFTSKHMSVDGTVIDEFVIDGTNELIYMTNYNSEGADEYAISDKVISFRVNYLWGVMDKHTGAVLIPAKYTQVRLASEKIVECDLDPYSDSRILYDLKGNVIE